MVGYNGTQNHAARASTARGSVLLPAGYPRARRAGRADVLSAQKRAARA